VRVQVDQPGRHDLSSGFDDLGTAGAKISADRGDGSPLHGDVGDRVERLAGIDDSAATHHDATIGRTQPA
jgi:hypothetical protein